MGRAVGDWINPGYGDAGAAAGTLAGKVFGLELEGLSHEDREFESVRAFIRFAQELLRQLEGASPGADPRATVRSAVVRAARRRAPGLLRRDLPKAANGSASGTWRRQNGHIVLSDV